jgi:hypothetical protein
MDTKSGAGPPPGPSQAHQALARDDLGEGQKIFKSEQKLNPDQ